jgi:hypothetical protein
VQKTALRALENDTTVFHFRTDAAAGCSQRTIMVGSSAVSMDGEAIGSPKSDLA